MNNPLTWWIEIEPKFGKVKNDALAGSGRKYIERRKSDLGTDTGYPPIQSRVRSNYLIVTEIKRSCDIEEGVTPPHSGVSQLPDDVFSTSVGERELFGLSQGRQRYDGAQRHHAEYSLCSSHLLLRYFLIE